MGLIVYGSCINAFSQKILIMPHNPGYAVLQLIVYKGLFSSFAQGNRLKETFILQVFLKETLFRSIWSFWSKKYEVIVTLDLLLILHNKMDQEAHENCISCFLRKTLIWGNLIFLFHFLILD